MFRAHRVAAYALLLVLGFLVVFRSGSGLSTPVPVRGPDGQRLGGFSGFELLADGRVLALSDRGYLVTLQAGGGTDAALEVSIGPVLRDEEGAVLVRPAFDAEGLARGPDGGIVIAFENPLRIWRYGEGGDTPIAILPLPRPAEDFPGNTGIEALATGPDGTLYAIPEYVRRGADGVEVWRLSGGVWDMNGTLPQAGRFEPVGADFSDGALYVLERALVLPIGFASRIRRVGIADGAITGEAEIWRSRPGRFGNLEGIAVTDGTALMISDDNLNWFQRSHLVRVTLP